MDSTFHPTQFRGEPKKLILILAFFLPVAAEAQLELARDGATDYTIVQSAAATEPEKFAAKELALFLKRVTGAEFAIATAAEGKRIHLGWTKFAAQNGIDCEKLGEEEWVIRTVGDGLILTGGRPRGTMYAVYEFLEDYVGCHWLDRRTEVIPTKPTLEIPAIHVRDKPHFWQRQLHSPTGSPDPPSSTGSLLLSNARFLLPWTPL